MTNEQRQPISIRLDTEQHLALRHRALDEKRSVSAILRELVAEYLEATQ